MRATHATRTRAGALSIFAAGAIILGSLGTARADQRVDWMNNVNVTVRGNTLQKTGGCQGCDDAGAVSRQMIWSGDGSVEFTVGETNTFWLAGLSHRDDGTRFNDIDFAFRFNGAGAADVMESGVYQPGGDTSYAAGDVFRVAVVRGKVQYMKNGRVLRESQKTPDYPLVLDVAFGTVGATVQNARIETNESRLSRSDSRLDRFDSLDANDNGVISRDEWQGPRRGFERLDINRDGVLTRREVFRGEAEVVGTSGDMVRVDPTQRWTDTGLYVQAGDTIMFDAEGTAQLSDNPNDIATPAGSRLGRRATGAPLGEPLAGSLIARIGNSGVILVGDRGTIARAPVSGRLYLGVNDDHLLDNSGEYRVLITIEPR